MFNRLKKYFLSGLVVFLPVTLTIYLFIFVISFADNLLGKYLEPFFVEKFGVYFRGLSILIAIYFIIVIGFFVTNYLGRRVYSFFEHLLVKLPFFKQVYPAIKEMAIFLFSRDQLKSFKQVVLVPYPRKGIYSIGFLTNDSAEKISELIRNEMCNVFIPSAPGPLTGFVVMVPKNEIIVTNYTVEEAIKFIVSGGVVNPNGQ